MDQSSYFIDTSALFKRYVEEAGSLTINRLLDSGATCYVSLATLIAVSYTHLDVYKRQAPPPGRCLSRTPAHGLFARRCPPG